MPGSKSDYLENALLDHALGGPDYTRPGTVYLALFTVAPSDSGGGTEVSGGSYARKSVTNNSTNFPGASSGQKLLAVAQAFATATANWGTAVAWGILDALTSGNLLYWGYLMGPAKNFIGDASTDVITSSSHGYADTTKVRVEALSGTSLPTGISAGTDYYVRDSTTNTFKLAATSGGTAIDLTADGCGVVYTWLQKQIDNGDTASFGANQLAIQED